MVGQNGPQADTDVQQHPRHSATAQRSPMGWLGLTPATLEVARVVTFLVNGTLAQKWKGMIFVHQSSLS
jgi:hypothetical protein